MSATSVAVQQAAIRQYAKRLQLATLGGQFAQVAEQAVKEKKSHLSYLEASLEAEVEERERNTVARRIREARSPKVKTLEEPATSQNSQLWSCGSERHASECSCSIFQE
jgi:DNA replication protein DnaC